MYLPEPTRYRSLNCRSRNFLFAFYRPGTLPNAVDNSFCVPELSKSTIIIPDDDYLAVRRDFCIHIYAPSCTTTVRIAPRDKSRTNLPRQHFELTFIRRSDDNTILFRENRTVLGRDFLFFPKTQIFSIRKVSRQQHVKWYIYIYAHVSFVFELWC